MTSPELPFVPNGLIWDGATEYQNTNPDGFGTTYLLRMVGDGSRRYTAYNAVSNPMQWIIRRSTQEDAWGTIGVSYENGGRPLLDHGIAYLDYDGSVGPEPVNQIPYLQDFRGHAARFMHQLDATIGHHSLQAAEENDRETIRQTIRDMIGAAWLKYNVWEVVDPEELIVGGNFDGTLLWKRSLEEMQGIDRLICGQCNFSNFARLCLTDMNIPLFRSLMHSGIVYTVNIETTPKWEPAIFDVATDPRSEYYDMIEAGALAARRHYDTVVGVQDIATL